MGCNAWLSLVLAPATKDALAALSKQVQALSPVALDEMPFCDMHMTLVFLGAALKSAKRPQRSELEAKMREFDDTAAGGGAALAFEQLELFPPGKHNLLIARFRVDPASLLAIRELQAACVGLGLASAAEYGAAAGSGGAGGNARSLGEDAAPFVAHVTLGKFRGMRADQMKGVAAAVSGVNDTQTSSADSLALPFEACCLCDKGPSC